MNIFVLDKNPDKAAEYHCDKHVVKMVLETAQLLSTAVNTVTGKQVKGFYKTTHLNHPCAIWTRESYANFQWLWELGMALSFEYSARYGKDHKSHAVITKSLKYLTKMPAKRRTPFVLAMPEEYRTGNAVESYRNYYKGEKSEIAKWKQGEPIWW